VVAQADGISRTSRRFEKLTMPIRLDTVLRKVEQMSNRVNSDLLKDFYQHMKDNGTSQNYQKGNMKAMVHLAKIEVEGPRILHDTSRRLYERLYRQESPQQ
jgi:hypothetical protein